jgi:hypothetical protein
MESATPILELPTEILLTIASFLPLRDVLSITRTCKLMRMICSDDNIWRGLLWLELKVQIHPQSLEILDKYICGCHALGSQRLRVIYNNTIRTWKDRFLCMRAVAHVFTERPIDCDHYHGRQCKIMADCCGLFIPCRHCHDERPGIGHAIDRFATTTVFCKRCGLIQPIGPRCISNTCNGAPFAVNFCPKCKVYYDGVMFHCDGCGMCKKGDQNAGFHCHTCNSCFKLRHESTHQH